MNQAENRLDAILNINKFPANQTKYYQLDKTQDWLADLLLELSDKASNKSAEEILSQGNIALELELLKKQKNHRGYFLILKGKISVTYITECVRTLAEMKDSLELEIKACFIPAHLQQDEQLKDQTEIFEENELLELYYYAKGQVPISEMLHEQIYLNLNQYPVADQEAPLVWGKESSSTKQ